MSAATWHPCKDGLTPIAEAVHKIVKPHPVDIVKWLKEGVLYSPLQRLLSVTLKSWADAETNELTSTRREMTRQWLQFHGHEAVAKEFEARLTKLIDELDSWQSHAAYIACGRENWQTKERNGESVELVDIFGDENRERFENLTSEALGTWQYLGQLDRTIRAKLECDSPNNAAHRPDDDPQPAKPTGDPQKPAAKLTDDVVPSTDFRSVRWFGEVYSFTANQAPVVKLLFEHWELGAPDVGDDTLLSAVDLEAPPARLAVLFRKHPAWGTMIVPGGTKGTRQLRGPAGGKT